MKAKVTFKEMTTKTIDIEGIDIFDIMGLAEKYAENPSETINFEKNPDSYMIEITNIKEIKE